MAIILAVSWLIPSCGNPSAEETENEQETYLVELHPRVVIGSEGLDEYAFGGVSDAEFLSDSSIVILDRLMCQASVYSHDGDYLFSFGRGGEGPGEFTRPSRLLCFEDYIVVIDRLVGHTTMFDTSGEYIGELADSYSTSIPGDCCDMGELGILGSVSEISPLSDDVDLYLDYMVLVFDRQLVPVDTLFSNTYLYHPGDMTDTFRNSFHSCSFTADDEGNLFLASASTEEYSLSGYDTSMEPHVLITRDLAPVAKSSEEIEAESNRLARILGVVNQRDDFQFEAPDCRYMIPPYGLHSDSRGRIWVVNGLFSMPMFDVYDYAGNHLFITKIHGIPDEEQNEMLRWTVSEQGLLAFSLDPVDYPRVYVYDLP